MELQLQIDPEISKLAVETSITVSMDAWGTVRL